MPDRTRGRAVAVALSAGLLVGGVLAGCGNPVAAPPASTPSASQAASTTPGSSAAPTAAPTGTAGASATSTATGSAPTSPGTRTPKPEESRSYPDPETGTYGTDLTVAGNALEFTQLRWYWGKDAEARCQKRKIEPSGAWCSDYYYEESGERVSTKLASGVAIKLLNEDAELETGTRAELDRAISDAIWPHFVMQLADGEAVVVEQVYIP